jgi:predicted dehydrogenase
MNENIRWGILGTGRIAREFADALQFIPTATLAAVGSRSAGGAAAFAGDYSVEHACSSYDELVALGDVDAIYIGTPHPMHVENAAMCLNNGKHVLCEKPFTVNARQARLLVDLARQKQLFLMEAMWSRYVPAIQRLKQLVDAGEIGVVREVEAEFCFSVAYDPNGRLFDPALAGGALLDVGIYPISLACFLLGFPGAVEGTAEVCLSGVDKVSNYTLTYASGAVCRLRAAIMQESDNTARVTGESGTIHLPREWWAADSLTIETADGTREIHDPIVDHNFVYEAREAERCIHAGLLESPVMPLDDSVRIMAIMDELRRQFGLRYPLET